MSFPKDFLWGTATAAYQIEGGRHEDGTGRNIWDDYCEQPGKIMDRSSGDIACDHYHRFREDVELMASVGIRNYRFSVSWARILPEGTGKVNEKGIAFYNALIDCLLEHGIRPFMTLYHWDLPSALYRKGAWMNPEMPDWFAEYTALIAERFGDRVKDFITINEPQCVLGLGYQIGVHAPGLKASVRDHVIMAHNLLKCHGRACLVLREKVPDCRIGFAPCGDPMIPYDETDLRDIEAARKAYFDEWKESPAFEVSWYSDPAILGHYPESGMKLFGQCLPEGWEEDMKLICQPLDYYMQNIYMGQQIRHADNADGFEHVMYPAGFPKNAANWPVTPKALYWGPKFLCERYGLPLIISENGMDCHDAVSLDGKVHDPNRTDYIHRYLLALKKACEEGVPVKGYFYWSFLDNFEWAKGYMERFGLTYVDYTTQERILKDSAYWYAEVMKENGENL